MGTIVIDFDGIIVVDKYPKIGMIKRGAKETINKLYEDHTIIINTCRVGQYETDAIKALNDAGIKYHYFNNNSDELINKYGVDCRKISGDIYIDDKNVDYKFASWRHISRQIYKKLAERPIIIAIVGESGNGKNVIADYLESEHGIGAIESYTTRPQRYEGETGHNFITEEEYGKLNKNDMIAFTEFGNHKYCCLKKDVKAINSYIIDENGLEYLEANFRDEYDIITWRVYRDDRLKNISVDRKRRDNNMFKPYHDEHWSAVFYNNKSKELLFFKVTHALQERFVKHYGNVEII